MSSPVVAVSSDDPLRAALVPMALKGFRQIPVTENGRLRGILYRSEILKRIVSFRQNNPALE
jgi:CBS domain-containing protein